MKTKAAALALALIACSGSSVYLPAADGGTGVPGSTAGDGGATSNDGGGPTLVPSGACQFDFQRSDGKSGRRQGRATARMNGTGNVIVKCTDIEGTEESFELGLGNGNYGGPRTYVLASDHDEGRAEYIVDPDVRFEPADSVTSGCKVTVLGPRETFLPSGAEITGTFACEGLVSRDDDATLDVTGGSFNAPVR